MVDLPEPTRPSRATCSPALTVKLSAVERPLRRARIAEADIAELDRALDLRQLQRVALGAFRRHLHHLVDLPVGGARRVRRESNWEIWASGAIARPARIEQAIRPPMVSSRSAIMVTPTITTPA